MKSVKQLLFFYIIFSFSLSIFGQPVETLGDNLNSIFKKEFPELQSNQLFTLPLYPRTYEPQIESKLITNDQQNVSIKVTMVGDLDEKAKEHDFNKFIFRSIYVPSRLINQLGDKAILVSLRDEVQIRFFKTNLRVDINYKFPVTSDVAFYASAPTLEESKALKIAQIIDNAIDRKRIFSPCYNDFQNYSIPNGETAEEQLFAAVVRGEIKEVKDILKKPINFDSVFKNHKYNEDGKNKIMHVAAKQGCLEIMKLLVKAKANVNVKNATGETPLISAIRELNLDVIEFLLESGADVNIKGKPKNTAIKILRPVPLTTDAFQTNVSQYKEFKPKSSDIVFDVFYDSNKYYRDYSPQTRIEIMKLLVKYGLEIKNDSNLLFKIPCEYKDWCPQITEFLLIQGVNPNETNDEGQSILLKTINDSQRYPYQAIPTLKVLIKYGANVNAFYKNKSILENVIEAKSALTRSDEIIQILKDVGAK